MDLAQLAGIDELFQETHGRIVFEGVPDHEHQVALIGQLHEVLGAGAVEGNGFLNQRVQPMLQALPADGMVGEWRRGNHHAVQVHFE